jgi:hypothetical protein
LGTSVSLCNILFNQIFITHLYYKSILSNINIYEATVPDRMHHLDLGLFHYLIDFTRNLIRFQHGNSYVDKMDHRIAKIPRFTDLKIFANGLKSIARLTAKEYRDLMKVMIFVMDNLYEDKVVENFVKNEDLVKLYEAWNEMYVISRFEAFKESDLIKFKVRI